MKTFFTLQKSMIALATLFASSSAFAYGGFAAIVYNPTTGAFGAFHGSYSRIDAENAALSYTTGAYGIDAYALESGTSGLKETWAHNGWIALAVGGTHWGTAGIHTSQAAAEQDAFNRCGGYANGCYILRSLSSYDSFDDQDGTRPQPQPAIDPVPDYQGSYNVDGEYSDVL